MSKKLSGTFWGIILLAVGVFALAQNLGYEFTQDPTIWMFIFGGISLAALIFYVIDGWRRWGWLFPVGIFGALAIMMGFVTAGKENPAMAAPLFIGIGLPFVVAFFLDRRQNWWALIPAGVMVFLSFVLFVADKAPGEWIGTGLFWILAAAFFLVFLTRRAAWAAIVAYVMLIMGFMPLLGTSSRPELAAVVMFAAIGLPFLFVYLRNSERWWALIPAGILLTMGLVTAVLLLPGMPTAEYDARLANAIIFAGVAVTFALLWLRHHKRWGMIAAALAGVLAVASVFFRDAEGAWPLMIILAGGFLLYQALGSKKSSS